jgi:hypothetical protein
MENNYARRYTITVGVNVGVEFWVYVIESVGVSGCESGGVKVSVWVGVSVTEKVGVSVRVLGMVNELQFANNQWSTFQQ